MVMALSSLHAKGNILNFISVRDIRDDCLILRAPQAPKWHREYQAVLHVIPVNFPLMSEGEKNSIIEGFRSYVASRTTQDRTVNLHLRTSQYEIDPYLKKLDRTANTHPQQQYQEMAKDHQAFVQHLAASQALLIREFYVRVSVLINVRSKQYKRLTPAEVFDLARGDLVRKVADVMQGLAKSGILSTRLLYGQLAHYALSCVHKKYAEDYGIPSTVLDTLNYPIQADFSSVNSRREDQLAFLLRDDPLDLASELPDESTEEARTHTWGSRFIPLRKKRDPDPDTTPDFISLPELLQPASVEQTPHYICVHHNTDEYIRARAVTGYPAYAVPGWVDQLLSIDEPYIDILLFIETLDPTRYIRSLSRKLTSHNTTQFLEAKHGKTADPYIAAARDETYDFREKLVGKTEQIHAFSLYILTRAESKQTLRERDEKVALLLKSLELQNVALEYEHLQAWLSCVNGRDILHRTRKLDTSSVACAMPFCSNNVSTEPGALIGLTPSGGLVIIDPASDQLENGHELVFAQSGSGKSFYEKLGLMRHLLLGMEGIVIDPDNEFARICERYKGTNIRLSPGNFQINPFDLGRIQSESNPLEEKMQSLLILFDLLLAEKNPGVLSQKEKSYLYKIITNAYADRGILLDPATHDQPAPSLREVYALIIQSGDPYTLADRLARYVSTFPERTGVQLDNQLVVFNLKDLKDLSNDLLRIALYVITQFVWMAVRKDRTPRRRLLLIDEASVLMEFLEGGQFLEELSRRARKYNLHLRMVTQNVDDFLASKAGQTIMQNASMKMLMHHDSTSLDTITRAFQLSEEERKFLEIAPKGQGLFFCRSSHVPIMVVASDLEYELANTNPNELLLLEHINEQVLADEHEQEAQEASTMRKNRDELHILLPRVFAPAHRGKNTQAESENAGE